MKLSFKPVQPCTSFKQTPQQPTFQCITITQPNRLTRNLNLTMQTLSPKNLENLFLGWNVVERSGNLASTSSALSMPSFSGQCPKELGKNWMDYQGIKNWEGLLDPLNDNLRGEIIRYGHFVEAAYRACNFDPSSPSYAMCKYSKKKLLQFSGFSGTGYRVSKYLKATSGIQLPSWVDKAPNWMAKQSSWIGYVAICHDQREITRLGRRDVVIALRGTATCLEWLENLRATLTPLSNNNNNNNNNNSNKCCSSIYSVNCCPMVESGFLSLYTSKMGTRHSLQDMVKEEIARIIKAYPGETLSFTIAGHSLGAALATLMAYDIKQALEEIPLVTVISFGGPRVGNHSFRHHLDKQGTKILRIVNSDDLITKVPGFVIDNNTNNNNNNDNFTNKKGGHWIQKLVEDTQWVYADVGCELRLSSSDSPYLNGINIAACHELKTYLQLVNGFVSSNCPVRATAKKMMQKANYVKSNRNDD
ncbi:phospholipase A(1) DAD1, chloroplastic-like [Nicotiana tomentosiformis]|uniref:phospholipase A(1) DAD1, chloroplastic-like n=1 Tax=Nicotiana tomentosiformis TaxID=4098 RepID=UPI00051B6430|nr:phospholipase A(1) DAD1, chloroplastic-like [Nicotiana tomentosiformis]